MLLGIALLWVFVWVGGNERRVEIKSGVWRFCFRGFDLVLSGLPFVVFIVYSYRSFYN